MPNILHTHPTIHKMTTSTYFIFNTINLHPKYQHLAKSFYAYIKTRSSFAPIINLDISTLTPIHTNAKPPTPILYALCHHCNHKPLNKHMK